MPLTSVAKLERAAGPVKIDREMASRSAWLSPISAVVIWSVLSKKPKPLSRRSCVYPLATTSPGADSRESAARGCAFDDCCTDCSWAHFCTVFSTFGSVRQALLILSNIPFALVGGIVALWVTGEYLSVPASVGFIALLGIAVLNGVVLVSYFNQLQSEGMKLSEVVVQGAKRRLRPVLMTASITTFGLMPLLFASGPDSEIQRPLAIVVIGGLVTATALTLMLLPILYLRFGFSKQEVPHV